VVESKPTPEPDAEQPEPQQGAEEAAAPEPTPEPAPEQPEQEAEAAAPGADEPVPAPGADVSEKLAQIEARIHLVDALRKRQGRASLVGILLLLVLLLVFVYRIYSHFDASYVKVLKDEKQREEFLTKMLEETQAQEMVREQAYLLMDEMRNDIVPKLAAEIATEFRGSLPELQAAAGEATDRLTKYAKEHVEGRLIDALTKSLEGLDKELRRVFPELKLEELEEQLDRWKGVFIEELHDVIEERVARVDPSVRGLKTTVDQLAKTGPRPDTLEEAEWKFIEALIELIAFELAPDLGKDKAE